VALLAGVGTGVYKDIQEACNLCVKHKSKQEASKELYDKYDNYYRLYRSLYTALKQSFRELENINM
ncbi:MAG: xylulokinase, partial [Clostridiaceae bacterium]|nr:xylulokinase [Clostridiaceae bacterium]